MLLSTLMFAGRRRAPGPGSPATPSIEPLLVEAMQNVEAYTDASLVALPVRWIVPPLRVGKHDFVASLLQQT